MIDKKKIVRQRKLQQKHDVRKARKAQIIEQYKDDHTDIIRTAHKGSPPEAIYKAHKELAVKIRNEAHTLPSSRLILGQEFSNDLVEVMAWVSDIREFNSQGKKSTRILLDRPRLIRKHGTNQKARSFDSHTWIDIADIESAYGNTLHISIGDLIQFDASVVEYRGRIEHGQYGTKYGFHKLNDICSGYPFFTMDNKRNVGTLTGIKYDYPRHGEWVLRWSNPENYKTQPIPEYLNHIDEYEGWTI